MTDLELLELARRAAEHSYSPYSHFPVGAALECADGTVFTGCNVENAAYGDTICAERTAAVKPSARAAGTSCASPSGATAESTATPAAPAGSSCRSSAKR